MIASRGVATRVRYLSVIACFCFTSGIAGTCSAAEPAEVHGSSDVFSAPGVALAWAILRGASDVGTLVIVRVTLDPGVFAALAVVGRDPFTQSRNSLLSATPATGSVDLRVPRAHFADFPRTELCFYASLPAKETEPPKLVVFYLGVPDTTPEFASQAALDTYLAATIARKRANFGSKAP